jgi:hypothetical protein
MEITLKLAAGSKPAGLGITTFETTGCGRLAQKPDFK